MVKDEGMTKVNRIRCKVRNREDCFNSLFALVINTSAESDGRFGEVRCLTRGIAERLQNGVDFIGFISSSFPTNNQVISKKKCMNARTIRTQSDTLNIMIT
jgi:hypothetical protein